MKEFLVKEIEPDSFFSKTVYLDKSFVIAAPEMLFTKDLADTLERWGFDKVLSEGEPSKEYTSDKTRDAFTEDNSNIKELSQHMDADKLEKAEVFYNNFLLFVEGLFVKMTISNDFNAKHMMERLKDVVEFIKENRRFLMRIFRNIELEPDRNYLASHSMRSTILAVIIGINLKLPNHRLIELAIAALLHEVGMLRLPSQLYLTDKPLTDQEKKAITTHPVLGYGMLKSFDFPLSICDAALEHHERENGTGYPRQISGEKIGLYSKIIAVACSYEALSTNRPHKEARDGHSIMLELLRNEGKQYDDTIIRALVLSLSIYPIGLYVLLSTGKKGQVVDINPENPRFPIVQIFGEFTPDGKIKKMQTAPDVLTIVRPLNHTEMEN
jgi:HD-GYP domain-containing protein (c-di-GMP phosphodiesterase class II)